jgi:hypothetical protein
VKIPQANFEGETAVFARGNFFDQTNESKEKKMLKI